MSAQTCPGLPANWLNGWLAAVGVCVLVPDAQLSWTQTSIPLAQFTHPSPHSVENLVANAIPTSEQLRATAAPLAFPIGTPKNQTATIDLDKFHQRAPLERAAKTSYLAGSLTDLAHADAAKAMEKSAFDPAAPGSTGGALYRLIDCLSDLPDDESDRAQRINETLQGRGRRIAANGLGFDIRRIPAGLHCGTDNHVDPIIEILAFSALALFPVRGNGLAARTRGWTKGKTAANSFAWPAWTDPLDQWAIDALIDRFNQAREDAGHNIDALRKRAATEGITAAYDVMPYQASGTDMTRGYGSGALL